MERGLQASADDTGKGNDGGHMGNERSKETGVRGRGSTTLALTAAVASPC